MKLAKTTLPVELLEPLTHKEKTFVLSYIANGFNGTQAALKAYKCSYETAAPIAYENLRKPHIAACLEAVFTESCMSAEEAMSRLSGIARADIGDMLDDTNGWFDYDKVKALGLTHLIKELKQNAVTTGEGASAKTEVQTFVKLHDAHTALQDILKLHGKFRTTLEHTAGNGEALKILAIEVKTNYE